MLLNCVRWEEQRRIIWKVWEEYGKKGVWIDMKWLLFSKEGTEAIIGFGRETGWLEERWKEKRRWSKDRKEEWGIEMEV